MATAAAPPYCTKVLTKSDVRHRLAWPTRRLARLLDLNAGHLLNFRVVDEDGVQWRFRRSWRKAGLYLKPVVSGEWLRFVQCKSLQPGDLILFHDNPTSPKVLFTVTVRRININA